MKYFVYSLKHVNYYLQNNPFYNYPCIYADRFVIQEKKLLTGNLSTNTNHELIEIRIWKTKSFLNLWYSSKILFIAGLDYIINDDHIKCENIILKSISNYSLSLLTQEEINKLSHSMIEHLKITGQKKNKSKIIIDVHNNLRNYKQFYEKEGFLLTNNKSKVNHTQCELLL